METSLSAATNSLLPRYSQSNNSIDLKSDNSQENAQVLKQPKNNLDKLTSKRPQARQTWINKLCACLKEAAGLLIFIAAIGLIIISIVVPYALVIILILLVLGSCLIAARSICQCKNSEAKQTQNNEKPTQLSVIKRSIHINCCNTKISKELLKQCKHEILMDEPYDKNKINENLTEVELYRQRITERIKELIKYSNNHKIKIHNNTLFSIKEEIDNLNKDIASINQIAKDIFRKENKNNLEIIEIHEDIKPVLFRFCCHYSTLSQSPRIESTSELC